jgi:hypothetical protein
MTEEAFLRYRMAVVERMPDSPSKRAVMIAIQSRMKGLGIDNGGAELQPNGPSPGRKTV